MIRLHGRVLGTRETLAAFGQFHSLLRQAAMGAMTESLTLFSKTVRDDYLQGPYPTEIARRSGSFRATFQRGNALNIWEVLARGTQILGTFGSQDKRGNILNDGGTIRPVRSQFLAIRTEFTKTPAGVVRPKYQQPLRQIPNTFVVRSRSGGLTVWERLPTPKARRGRLSEVAIPIARLVRSVTIRGRKFMQRTEQKTSPMIQGIFRQRFETVLTRLQDTLRRIGR